MSCRVPICIIDSVFALLFALSVIVKQSASVSGLTRALWSTSFATTAACSADSLAGDVCEADVVELVSTSQFHACRRNRILSGSVRQFLFC